MADHPHDTPHVSDDQLHLGDRVDTLKTGLLVAAGGGLLLALLSSFAFGGLRRFFLAYLLAYCVALSLMVGGLLFVLLQHATKAGWSVVVRRIPEAMGATVLPLVVMALPILATTFLPGETVVAEGAATADEPEDLFASLPTLYPWATPYVDKYADDESSVKDSVEDDLENDGRPDTNVVPVEGDDEATVAGAEHDDEHHADDHVDDHGDETVAGVLGATDGHGDDHAGGGHDDHPPAEAYTVLSQMATNKAVYQHLQHDYVTHGKVAYLNAPFFAGRVLICLGVLAVVGGWYFRTSTDNDRHPDPESAASMRKYSYVAILAVWMSMTVLSWDLVMTLDPHWYSTMFAVYFFAGAAASVFAVLAVALPTLQSHGFLTKSVTIEHHHDVGKFLFAFVFFWGYISFSQYMLIWYGALAEESTWFARRGASIVSENLQIVGTDGSPAYAAGFWTIVSAALLAGHFFIPFLGLLSRHVKRRPKLLAFWGVWVLIFHWLDYYWLITPEMPGGLWTKLPVPEVLATVGVLGVYAYFVVSKVADHALVPVKDPRLPESLAFHNI